MDERGVPSIFSSARRDASVDRAQSLAARGETAHWLAEDMAEEVMDRLDFTRFAPEKALVTGLSGVALSERLKQRGSKTEWVPAPDHEKPLSGGPFNLIADCAALEVVNDLPGALLHIRNALSDDGLFIGQILGAGGVPALRQIMLAADGERPAARIHPQIDNRAATALLERAGFKRQVVDSRTLTVRYSGLDRLIADLRAQALTSVLQSPAPYLGKVGLKRTQQAFDDLREDDGKVSETFEVLTLTGWR